MPALFGLMGAADVLRYLTEKKDATNAVANTDLDS
jgi:hypothetical protein